MQNAGVHTQVLTPPLYGDIVNHLGGYRLDCNDCGRLISGPVKLAHSRLAEAVERFENE